MAAPVYLLDDLLKECQSRPARAVGLGGSSALASHLISASTYGRCWAGLVSWVSRELDAGNAVTVPLLGTIFFRMYNMGIRIPQFELSDRFATAYEVEAATATGGARVVSGPVTKLNFSSIGRAINMDTKTVAAALTTAFEVLGEVMATGRSVSIDFEPVGKIEAARRKVDFNFSQFVDAPSKAAAVPRAGDGRPIPGHVPHSALRAQAAARRPAGARGGSSSATSSLHSRSLLNTPGTYHLPDMGGPALDSPREVDHRGISVGMPASPRTWNLGGLGGSARGARGAPAFAVGGKGSTRGDPSLSYIGSQDRANTEFASLAAGTSAGAGAGAGAGAITSAGTSGGAGDSTRARAFGGSPERGDGGAMPSPARSEALGVRSLSFEPGKGAEIVASKSHAKLAPPPLVDEFTRTRMAPYGDKVVERSLLDRIGTLYTPSAAMLSLNPDTREVDWHGGRGKDASKATERGQLITTSHRDTFSLGPGVAQFVAPDDAIITSPRIGVAGDDARVEGPAADGTTSGALGMSGFYPSGTAGSAPLGPGAASPPRNLAPMPSSDGVLPTRPHRAAPPPGHRSGGRTGLHLKTSVLGRPDERDPDVVTAFGVDGHEYIVGPRSSWRGTYYHDWAFHAPTLSEIETGTSPRPDVDVRADDPVAPGEMYDMSPRASHEASTLERRKSQQVAAEAMAHMGDGAAGSAEGGAASGAAAGATSSRAGGASSSSDQWRTSVMRYMHYLQHGAGVEAMPPMKEEWIEAIMLLLPPPPKPAPATYSVERILTEHLEAVRVDYERAIRKSMLDYVLRSASERVRLGISVLPPECQPADWGWGAGIVVPRTPRQWKERFWDAADLMGRDLYTTSPAMQALGALWSGYETRRLVRMPATDREAMAMLLNVATSGDTEGGAGASSADGSGRAASIRGPPAITAGAASGAGAAAVGAITVSGAAGAGLSPPELHEFTEQHNSHCDAVSREMVSSWLDAAAAIVADALHPGHSAAAAGVMGPSIGGTGTANAISASLISGPALSIHSLPAFCSAVSTLMSNQLRTVVEASVDRMTSFFERFSKRRQRAILRHLVGRHRAQLHFLATEKAAAAAAEEAAAKSKADRNAAKAAEKEAAAKRREKPLVKRRRSIAKQAEPTAEEAEAIALAAGKGTRGASMAASATSSDTSKPRRPPPSATPRSGHRRTGSKAGSAASGASTTPSAALAKQEASRAALEAKEDQDAAAAAAAHVRKVAEESLGRDARAPKGLEDYDVFERAVLAPHERLDVLDGDDRADMTRGSPFTDRRTSRLRPALTVHLQVHWPNPAMAGGLRRYVDDPAAAGGADATEIVVTDGAGDSIEAVGAEEREAAVEAAAAAEAAEAALQAGADGAQAAVAAAAASAPLPPPSIVFHPTVKDVEHHVMQLFEHVVTAFGKIHRVDVKLGLGTLPQGKSRRIPSVSLEEARIKEARRRILAVIRNNMADAAVLLEVFSPYEYLLGEEPRLDKFLGKGPNLHQCAKLIEKYQASVDEVKSRLSPEFSLDLILLDCSALNATLVRKGEALIGKVLESVVMRFVGHNLWLTKRFKTISHQLSQPPQDSTALVEAEAYLDDTREVELPALERSVESSRTMLQFLLERKHRVTTELLTPLLATVEWMNRMDDVVESGDVQVKGEREKLEFQFQRARDAFNGELEDLAAQVESFRLRGTLADLWSNAEEVEAIAKQLLTATETALSMNDEERRLGWPVTNFVEVDDIKHALEPHAQLWNLATEHHRANVEWTKKCVFVLNAETVTQTVDDMHRLAFKLNRSMTEDAPIPAMVAESIRQQLAEFKKHLPLLAVVCTEGMQERHWQEVSETVGFSIRPDKVTDLTKLIDIGMEDHIEALEVISEAARKEYSIHRALKKMSTDWEPMAFDLLRYKESGTHIVSGGSVDEVQDMLDDHALKIQGLNASPYAAPFQDAINETDVFVTTLQKILDVWVKVQATWLYLAPVFASEDINRQMPEEGRKFASVDATWREVLKEAAANPACREVAQIDRMLERLTDANQLLEEVQAGLNRYLETKRLYFARFFFLSNDELLEILAETQDPTLVQPHLKKCFDGIAALEFTESREIVAMLSAEGERVALTKRIDPAASRGAVERWLRQVESGMRRTVRSVMAQSRADYPSRARIQWVQQWPGQNVLTVSQMYWTREVEDAINTRGVEGLAAYHKTLNAQLHDIVQLVRGELSKLARKTLSALTVIDVHARDVVADLKANKVDDVSDFDWISQLRYYWQEATAESSASGSPSPGAGAAAAATSAGGASGAKGAAAATSKSGAAAEALAAADAAADSGTMLVKMINSSLEYAYEYLGNSSRLVITPLTDRCYRTLIGAVYLQYGGAPEGPAGTGKTETVKDLAKALARQCVVFNCSDQLDYLAMAKFFKGLASSGAWACFDEFNRIQVEVLSVIAQQITTIQQAIAARKERFVFEGTEINLQWTANVFITMNPGYAGRAELPDNLKVLFRTVAMMVPDYAMIAEIILYSMGYLDARNLASKIVATYRLCSEQLSRQSHYDYGMRAVIAVLNAAGSLKRRFPDEREDVLMLRAITDVNLAKFLSPDLPLFQGITSDLFPGVELPSPDYADFDAAVRVEMEAATPKLQATPYFLDKVTQTYEMLLVRHGFMVVGDPIAGKTSALRVLSGALTALSKQKKMPCNLNPKHELATHVHALNPKALALGELYGCFDLVSHEWTNGVLARLFKLAAADTSEVRHWIIFDGPVDAIWIENMNTVLDDNKKLCLMSGEIVAMTPRMSMIFEPMDLLVASPATVSRCGMVYLEPHKLGWEPLVTSWIETLPPCIAESELRVEFVWTMWRWLFPQASRFAEKALFQFVPVTRSMVATSLMGIMRSNLMILGDASVADGLQDNDILTWIESSFLFGLVWSVGGVLDAKSRAKFDVWLRRGLNGDMAPEVTARKLLQPFPSTATVHGFMLASQPGTARAKWSLWSGLIETDYKIPKAASFGSIIVPTVDTIRYSFLLKQGAEACRHMLFVGPTGTGKSVYITDQLHRLDREKFKVMSMGLSAQTTAAQTQSIIEAQLDKRKKFVRGPAPGVNMIVFVDDLNMPAVEEYGAQPPLELLRQCMGSGGWYELKDMQFLDIVDTYFVAAMGPPGGGRNPISPRVLRLFQAVSTTSLDDDTMTRIFGTILAWHFEKGNYSMQVATMTKQLIKGTLLMYTTACTQLLPTPAKSHYTFNLRDFGRVVQGITQLGPVQAGTDCDKMARLWIHEVLRVFFDRLSHREDRDWFIEYLRDHTHSIFGRDFDALLSFLDTNGNGVIDAEEELRGLLFGSYMQPGIAVYDQIPFVTAPAEEKKSNEGASEEELALLEAARDGKAVTSVITEYLAEYNAMSTKPMNLVIFMFVIEHVSRITRILRMPGGHALLVGVGGSGRQSLTRLGAHICGADLFQVEVSKTFGKSDWHEYLRDLMTHAGGEGRQSVFLLSDTQVTDESFLEDINNLLNTGDVPNLFAPDEKQTLMENVAAAAKAERLKLDTPHALYQYFNRRVRDNLHIVLAFSPIGDAFRTRLRKFPSLVSICSIDWYTEWPEDALASVAESVLADTGLPKPIRATCTALCITFHEDVAAAAERFASELRRHVYLTPTSYLELLTTFRDLLASKRAEVQGARRRYTQGLDRLSETEGAVEIMQQQLENMKPVLVQSTKDTEEMMAVVDKETVEAEKLRQVMAAEEEIANAKANDARLLKEECEHDLGAAMPILNAAIAALNTLKKADIVEVKSMTKPPPPVVIVMETVCHLLGVPPNKVRDPENPQKTRLDYWEPAKRVLLSDTKFLQNLISYDKDNIDSKVLKKVRPFMSDPSFDPDVIRKASTAAFGLSQWVRAMVEYDRINKLVAPKRARLAKSQAEFDVVMESLKLKQAELRGVEEKLDDLGAKLAECERTKAELEHEIENTGLKLERAEKLIAGLGSEASRWKDAADDLAKKLRTLTGDVLLSSGVVAYLSAFTPAYRAELQGGWIAKTVAKGLPCSGDKFSLASTLGDPVSIRAWNIAGLPTDNFSTENGIIVSNARRWPLMIDPQGQANKWVRNMEKNNKLNVLKINDKDFMRRLEAAVTFGRPVLLENIGEELDPALEPLLLKQVFQKGSSLSIQFGEATIEYSQNFRLYMTTKMTNPHYLPEVSVKVTLLNFVITPEGLRDQMLGIVVAQERPELEAERSKLIIEGADNARQLKEIEDNILRLMSSDEGGNILDDSKAIDVLTDSKRVAKEITEKQLVTAVTEGKISTARNRYASVADQASVLFFCIADMGAVDPMYQYSIEWYNGLFLASITHSRTMAHVAAVKRAPAVSSPGAAAAAAAAATAKATEPAAPAEAAATPAAAKAGEGTSESKGVEAAPGDIADSKAAAGATAAGDAAETEGGESAAAPPPSAEDAKTDAEVAERCEALNAHFLISLFRNVCRSLFETHKLLFAFLLTAKMLQAKDPAKVPPDAWRFFLTGGVSAGDPPANACAEWLGDKQWGEMTRLAAVDPALEELPASLVEDADQWQKWVVHAAPHRVAMPEPWQSMGSDFVRLCVLRAMRPDVVMQAVEDFVATHSGEAFVSFPAFDLQGAFADSGPTMPLIFVLSPGSDPMASLVPLADKSRTELNTLSLGQGQGPAAAALIEAGVKSGAWVVLQNCHLYPSWMPELDLIVESMVPEDTNPDFRLWLTSYPSDKFPVAILQNGVKMTNEAPRGLRANLAGSIVRDPFVDPEFFDGCAQDAAFKRLLFGLCFFHAVVQERRSFGPLGWNIPYEFTDADLKISARQLFIFLNEAGDDGDVPYKAVRYLTGECNYGGRVTDDRDRRTLLALLDVYLTPDIHEPGYDFAPSGEYHVPTRAAEHDDFVEYIASLPATAEPEVFGLHPNATITRDQGETYAMCNALLATQPRTGGGTTSPDELVATVAADILGRLPIAFDLEGAAARYPVDYEESMNTVLCQELERFNGLVARVKETLSDVTAAIRGEVVMSAPLEAVFGSLFNGQVPAAWKSVSYPSLKPLSGYVADLVARLKFFQSWLDEGPPTVYWISGVFFTQSFLTGALQTFARRHGYPIDAIEFDFRAMPPGAHSRPEDGVLVEGLFLEGARWDVETQMLAESTPRELFSTAPVFWLLPAVAAELEFAPHYPCPLYKTSDRRGVLLTTGHSTNFVMSVRVPSDKPALHWVKRGVALLTQLDD